MIILVGQLTIHTRGGSFKERYIDGDDEDGGKKVFILPSQPATALEGQGREPIYD